MKGVVIIFELLITLLILIGTYLVFFSFPEVHFYWKEAKQTLLARDLLVSLDRLNLLYESSFNLTKFSSYLDYLFKEKPLLFTLLVRGTIKGDINVACNCTEEEKKFIEDWLEGHKGFAKFSFNGRKVNFHVCLTDLESTANPCLSRNPDVLIILGKKKLDKPKYLDLLSSLLKKGCGIVEVRDFSSSSEIDQVQKKIFGIEWVGTGATQQYDYFPREPSSVKEIYYQPWKYFYHLPINLEYNSSERIAGCTFSPSAKGIFSFNQTSYYFWICDEKSVCIDKDKSGTCELASERVKEGEFFSLKGRKFYLSYINGNVSIGISFKPEYKFADFLSSGGGSYHVKPSNDDSTRILLQSYPANFPVVILNSTKIANVAWIANFTKDGHVSDDERLLFISLLLWASNKDVYWTRVSPEKISYFKRFPTVTYINAVNKDMFEVYELGLKVASPY